MPVVQVSKHDLARLGCLLYSCVTRGPYLYTQITPSESSAYTEIYVCTNLTLWGQGPLLACGRAKMQIIFMYEFIIHRTYPGTLTPGGPVPPQDPRPSRAVTTGGHLVVVPWVTSSSICHCPVAGVAPLGTLITTCWS